MSNSSIWPIDRTLSGATTPCQSGPGSNGNEGLLWIPPSFTITGTSPSDCLLSCLRHSLGVLPLCWDAFGVFYSPSWLRYEEVEEIYIYIYINLRSHDSKQLEADFTQVKFTATLKVIHVNSMTNSCGYAANLRSHISMYGVNVNAKMQGLQGWIWPEESCVFLWVLFAGFRRLLSSAKE